jgi:radical SAM protein with 4Fe4S-binding SPASM domain
VAAIPVAAAAAAAAAAVIEPTGPAAGQRFILQCHFTERCHLSCAHCYREDRAELPGEAWRDIFAQFAELLALPALVARAERPWRPQLSLTGGEPLLHPEFWSLADHVRRRYPDWDWALLTTGQLLGAAEIRELVRLRPRFVQVSLDGRRRSHDSLRGPGDHHRALAAIRRLSQGGLPVTVSFTATAANWAELPAVVQAARRNGATSVWTDRFIPCGQAAGRQGLAMPPETVDRWLAALEAARLRHARPGRFAVQARRALQFRAAGSAGQPYRCTAGRSLLAVAADGALFPCRRLPRPVGRLPDEPLARLWEAPSLADLRASRVPAGCSVCRHRETCSGGLHCLAAALAGDPFAADPGCSLARGAVPAYT